jgi:hypothetical protein
MVVVVQTTSRRYAIRRTDIFAMSLITGERDLRELGNPERPALPVELGELLSPGDIAPQGRTRRHGLVVPLRRRPIVFLVERVDQMIEQPAVQKLPALLSRQLREPWATGVLEIDHELTLLIDLRAVARSVFAQRPITS